MKKTLAIILSLVMMFSVFQITALGAFAAENDTVKEMVKKSALKELNTKLGYLTQENDLLGDVNADGKLSVVDAKWVLQSIANIRRLSSEQKEIADVNGDTKISVVDAKMILQAVAGIISLGPEFYPYFYEIPDFGAMYNIEPELMFFYDESLDESDVFCEKGAVEYIYSADDVSKLVNIDKYLETLTDLGFYLNDFDSFDEEDGYETYVNMETYTKLTIYYVQGGIGIYTSVFEPLTYTDFEAPDFGETVGIKDFELLSDGVEESMYAYETEKGFDAKAGVDSYIALLEKDGYTLDDSYEFDEGFIVSYYNEEKMVLITVSLIDEETILVDIQFWVPMPEYTYEDLGVPDFGEFMKIEPTLFMPMGEMGSAYNYDVKDVNASETTVDDYVNLLLESGFEAESIEDEEIPEGFTISLYSNEESGVYVEIAFYEDSVIILILMDVEEVAE